LLDSLLQEKREIKMHIKSSQSRINFSDAFSELQEQRESLKISAKDGVVCIGSRNLLRFFSPLVDNIFKDVPCCSSNEAIIIIPDVCKDSVNSFLGIIQSGISGDNRMSINKMEELKETANMLGVDMGNMEYGEKSRVDEDKDPNFVKSGGEVAPDALQEFGENAFVLQIKTEITEGDNEALLKADPPPVVAAAMIKSETLDQNVDVEMKTAEFPAEDVLAKSRPFIMAPTPTPTPSPTPTMSSYSSSKSPKSPNSDKYLKKVRSSKGTKRSISEETMAALAKMMKDPKRKPTMDEMEELLNRAKSFKDVSTVRATEEKKRDSPRSPERRSERSRRRSSSRDRRHSRGTERRPDSRERKSSYDSVPPQYVQPQLGHGQFQNHPQLAQHGQVQYVVQQNGALQAIMPGTVPMQYQYSTVQGMEQMQYNMLPVPATHQIKIRSPSPVARSRKSPDESPYLDGVRKSDRSMAEKKASLLSMTVEEKRRMTCLDWNSGLCPRLDAGKLCVFGGSKKKHICSKIIKASGKLGGAKVCWGKHREGEHKERLESRDRGYLEDTRSRDYRR